MITPTKRYTVEEFDQFVLLPENADRNFEYIGGEVYEVVSNNYSSELGMLMGIHVGAWVLRHQLGRITGADGGYMVMGERYIPDVGFISFARQPDSSHEAYNPNAPDLAIEVFSPTDSEKKLSIKTSNYMAAGTVVWVLYPDDKEIAVHRPGQPVIVLTIDDTLDGGDVLPGFTLAVREVFGRSEAP